MPHRRELVSPRTVVMLIVRVRLLAQPTRPVEPGFHIVEDTTAHHQVDVVEHPSDRRRDALGYVRGAFEKHELFRHGIEGTSQAAQEVPRHLGAVQVEGMRSRQVPPGRLRDRSEDASVREAPVYRAEQLRNAGDSHDEIPVVAAQTLG